jgi:hypothetical protein
LISTSLSKHQRGIGKTAGQPNVDINAEVLGETKKAVNGAEMLLDCSSEANEKAVPLAIALVP